MAITQYENPTPPPVSSYDRLVVSDENNTSVANLVFENGALSYNRQTFNGHIYYTFNDGSDKWSNYIKFANQADIDELSKKFDQIKRMAFEACYPVGCTYIQLPGHKSPGDLLGMGSWQNISSRYKGAFFRAYHAKDEQHPKAYNYNFYSDPINSGIYSGFQSAMLPNIKGTFYAQQNSGVDEETISGAFTRSGSWKVDSGWSSGGYKNLIRFDAGYNNISETSQDAFGCNIYYNDGEARPMNYAIMIWERIG